MTGWDVGSAGIDPERVAELLVTLAKGGPGRRGSGYRVSPSTVLTAAHVVRDAARVRVRFDADRPSQWLTEGTIAWSDPTIDVAVVTITPRPHDEGQVGPVGFGRVAERDAVLACSAMGFPRFKLRDDPAQPLDDGSPSQYRDSAHAVGTIAVLANRREGTLEVTVSPPERDPDPDRSPWEGMSGAAVWSAGRIIGLVAEHHRADGLGRLAATRVDRWYEHLNAEQLAKLQGLMSGLPPRANDLVDVIPPTPGEVLKAGYTAQVRDIFPDELRDREQELAELVGFCAGGEPYQWWQANAWAGKSALAAWFVLHPPAHVTVVSFFVTGRLVGQADSDAFTEAMIEQLAEVAGEQISGAATPAGRDRERRRLLDRAAARVGGRHERLVLVVDGLDEDEGAKPGSGKPSIASLLPRRPPEAVRMLVFGRPLPPIPADVPGDHPLRHCRRRTLAPSSYAQNIREDANYELQKQLHGDSSQVDVISFITAAGGGLTLRELMELTRQPKWKLNDMLLSSFGRSLRTRLPTDRPSEGAERVYLFAHETLRVTAEEELADDLGPYRQRIHEWADDYRAQGWPERTPRYLFRPYGRLLATGGDLGRLVSLATDPARHDRMLAYTQGDSAALAEITTTQQLVLAQQVPDLVALGRLAVHRDRLANRNRAVPTGLPTVWARLGQSHRGGTLARSITDPLAQAQALGAMAIALAPIDRNRALALAADAQQTAHSITNPYDQARALSDLAKNLADVDRNRALALAADAQQTAHSMSDPEDQGEALDALAETLAKTGQWDRAEQIARSITDPYYQARALGELAKNLADVDRDRALALAADAEQAAHTITELLIQIEASGDLAKVLANVDRDRALALAADAEQAAHTITDPPPKAAALSDLAKNLADVDRDRALALAADAEQIARSTTNPFTRAALAEALAGARQWDRAEQTVRTITDPQLQTETLGKLAEALAAAGQWDRAEQTARSTTNPQIQARALGAVAGALADVDRDWALALAADAEHVARTITDPEVQDKALGNLLMALADAGQWGRAEQAAHSISDPRVQVHALSALAKALAKADLERSLSLAADAQQTAHTITDPIVQAGAFCAVTEALAAARQWDQAEQTARRIITRYDQAWALGAVASALAAAGQWDRSEQTARGITESRIQTKALGDLAKNLADVDRDRALALAADAQQTAHTITDPYDQARALSDLAKNLADVDRDRALALAADAQQTIHSITDSYYQVRALSDLVKALAAARQWDRAEQTARSITDPSDQAWALSELTKALAEAGQSERAEQTARSITDPYAQVHAYEAIAAALIVASTKVRAGAGEPQRVHACQLLADILAGGFWLEAVRPLGKLNPLGVVAIYEALRASTAGQD